MTRTQKMMILGGVIAILFSYVIVYVISVYVLEESPYRGFGAATVGLLLSGRYVVKAYRKNGEK